MSSDHEHILFQLGFCYLHPAGHVVSRLLNVTMIQVATPHGDELLQGSYIHCNEVLLQHTSGDKLLWLKHLSSKSFLQSLSYSWQKYCKMTHRSCHSGLNVAICMYMCVCAYIYILCIILQCYSRLLSRSSCWIVWWQDLLSQSIIYCTQKGNPIIPQLPTMPSTRAYEATQTARQGNWSSLKLTYQRKYLVLIWVTTWSHVN